MLDDGAVSITREQALTGQPDRGHYIAAMARPATTLAHGTNFSRRGNPGWWITGEQQDDFHFMRKDSNGLWSNKFPSSAPYNVDMEGKPISDPEAAVIAGHYFVCGYYQVVPEKVGQSLDARQC